jgi:hypothetical protein
MNFCSIGSAKQRRRLLKGQVKSTKQTSKVVETVQAAQIIGLKDKAARQPAYSLSPAPDFMVIFE